ncbi:DUF5337 domain-containing protein [Actibacterium ureilyticum]|uniref:DUF5337 domain-containing protein n=1 Tax=Actibacterium ureilyticum TaxID=1590614 RepID=UPI000BAAA1C1|nr:DUF5337 domain-containing protein [Actibacterium ureilyticum]
MTGPGRHQRDAAIARQGRLVAVVIMAGGLIAIIAPWLTNILGLPIRFEMLFYLIALAAFVWALAVSYQIWRKSRTN